MLFEFYLEVKQSMWVFSTRLGGGIHGHVIVFREIINPLVVVFSEIKRCHNAQSTKIFQKAKNYWESQAQALVAMAG